LLSCVTSTLMDDVPVVLWSERNILSTLQFNGDSISTHELISLLKNLLNSQTEVVVLFLESQLHTHEVSSFTAPSSIFSLLREQTKNFNSIVVPYASIDSTFVHSLTRAIASKDGVSFIYNSGAGNDLSLTSLSEITNLRSLAGHPIFSNGRPDLILINLNHEGLSKESKFDYSGKIMEEVIKIVKGATLDYVALYTGVSHHQSLTESFKRFALNQKRFVSTIQAVYDNNTPITNITQLNWFNEWFPGWFWELFSVFFIFLSVVIFGACQLMQIQVPSKLPNPKKLQKQQ